LVCHRTVESEMMSKGFLGEANAAKK